MNPAPQIADTARRVVRTVIEVAGGVVVFSSVYPYIVEALGIPKDSNFGAWLASSVVVVGSVAAAITRILAIPAVNAFLGKIRLSGHSGTVTPADSYTKLIATIPAVTPSVPAVGDIAAGPQPRTDSTTPTAY